MTSQPIQNELSLLASRGVDVNPYLPVHPTFLYESLWNILVFTVLVIMARRKKFNGQIFCLYMALYGFGRMFIEGLRTDSLWLGNIRINQLIGLIFFLVFTAILLLIYFKERKAKKSEKEEMEMSTGRSEYASILKDNIKMTEEEDAKPSEPEDGEPPEDKEV